jgi:hypothetical protein
VSDTVQGKFILTHVQPDSRNGYRLTLESTGEFDLDAIVPMLGRIVTISEVGA